jgi:hypothetical protein
MATYLNPDVYVSVQNNTVVATTTGNTINACIVGTAPTTASASDLAQFPYTTSVVPLSNQNAALSLSGTPGSYTFSGFTVTNRNSGSTSYSYATDYQLAFGNTNGYTSGIGNVSITPGISTVFASSDTTGGTFSLAFYLTSSNNNVISTTLAGTASGIAYNASLSTIQAAIKTALGTSSFTSNIATISASNLTVSVTSTSSSNALSNGLVIEFSPTLTTTGSAINAMTTQLTTSGVTVSSNGSGITIANTLTPQFLSFAYNYAPSYGNVLNLFNSFQAVQQIYGTPFNNATGAINSSVSLGAQLAFANGASQVYVLAVKPITNGSTVVAADWQTAITTLAGNNNIDTIVPLVDYSTTSGFENYVSTYLNTQANNGTLQRAFLGRDTSSGTNPISQAPASAYVGDASTFQSLGASQRISIISPSVIQMTVSNQSTTQVATIPGYYTAAAVAGVFASLPGPQDPLTHKIVSGFYAIPTPYSASDLLLMQSAGVLVLKQRSDGTIYIRQGLTTDNANWLTQEISIIAAQDELYREIKTALTNANLIGSAFTSNTPSTIISIVQSTLGNAIANNLIQVYTQLAYTIPTSQPTQINITFSYSPTFPLNYINVTFGISPTAGTVSFSSTTNSYNTVTGV